VKERDSGGWIVLIAGFFHFFLCETERFIITTLREKRHPELTCTEAAEKLAKEYEK